MHLFVNVLLRISHLNDKSASETLKTLCRLLKWKLFSSKSYSEMIYWMKISIFKNSPLNYRLYSVL